MSDEQKIAQAIYKIPYGKCFEFRGECYMVISDCTDNGYPKFIQLSSGYIWHLSEGSPDEVCSVNVQFTKE